MALHRLLALVLMLFVLLPFGASTQTSQAPSAAPSTQAPSTALSTDQLLNAIYLTRSNIDINKDSLIDTVWRHLNANDAPEEL